MNEIVAPDVAIGALLLAAAGFYAAWHEYSSKNHRDAKVLAAVGAASLIGGAVSWL